MFTIIDNKPYYVGNNNVVYPCEVHEGGYKLDLEKGKVFNGAIKKYSLIEVYAKLGKSCSSVEIKEEKPSKEKKTTKKVVKE